MEPPSAPAEGDVQLRGDYAAAAADYTVVQDYGAYRATDHAVWAALLARQQALLPRYAVPAFIEGVAALTLDQRVPSFEHASAVLRARTGWSIVAVPGLIPEQAFFDHLAARRFPVTTWLRRPEELDYLEEPDLFHDFFGHVPLLTDPGYADFIVEYGRGGQRALHHGGLAMLARLYWYMVEFGLMETPAGLKCYGAGILSSSGETRYALDSPVPHRIRFSLERVLCTEYLIDDFQRNYFVIRDFRELIDAACGTDFAPLYAAHAGEPGIPAGTLRPEDEVLQRGTQAARGTA